MLANRQAFTALSVLVAAELGLSSYLLTDHSAVLTKIATASDAEAAANSESAAGATPAPPNADRAVAAREVREGRHVLCDGFHLLVLSNRYYKAADDGEAQELMRLYGPPETTVTVYDLPPRAKSGLTDLFPGGMGRYRPQAPR